MHIFLLLPTFVVLLSIDTGTVHAVACVPGAHWVDTCPSGTDALETSAEITIDLSPIGGGTVGPIPMKGGTRVFRGPGMTDPDHHIETEIVSLTLRGGGLTLRAGDGVGNLENDGPLHSPGRITEQPGNPALATSFFDIFFEIDGTLLGPLHNETTLRMQAVIPSVPPPVSTTYEPIPPCPQAGLPCQLFTANGQFVAILASHPRHHVDKIPFPPPLLLLGAGLASAAARRRKDSRGTVPSATLSHTPQSAS